MVKIGLLTFPFPIRDHLATSFSSIRAAVAEKANLFKIQKYLFKNAIEQARDYSTYRSYWLGTNRLLLNSIFFANLVEGFGNFGAEEEQE